ncbi:unnamed protein product [Darwinula stevensoni]|uniref:Amine oxidase domain-containing protein n=1 Tax=Darwinula stevensoni TaxID=69355 RepID=A0A7R8XBY5_9CRUS|nr:unnamed protein product [Darwinula stevensoni]CAG0891656.1 unnamed protein product [Darwinula stevensoni]
MHLLLVTWWDMAGMLHALDARAQGKKRPRVVVVGAGLAGLAAAHYLHKNGFSETLVLEANDRIGGRVRSVKFGSSLVELGANWIHGGCLANPIYQLARILDIMENPPEKKREAWNPPTFFTPHGFAIDHDLAKKAGNIFVEKERQMHALYVDGPDQDSNVTAEEYLDYILEEEIAREFPKSQRDDAHRIMNAMKNYLAFHMGDDLKKHSAQLYGTYKEMPGAECVAVPDGLSRIPEYLRSLIPGNKLRLSTEVCEVAWSERPLKVHCASGEVIEADHVIVTVSLGILKSRPDLFFPRLPESKTEAISRIGFGRVDKIFLEFERPFWVAGEGHIRLGWPDSDFRSRTGKEWNKYIYSFDEVTNNPNVLVGWLSADGAEMMEKDDLKTIKMICTETLRKFTGNPLLDPPKNVLASKWASDPCIRGAYSYQPMRKAEGPSDMFTLSQPVPGNIDPRILFAGEATHPDYFSTMHGAFMSGLREAQRIMDFYAMTGVNGIAVDDT